MGLALASADFDLIVSALASMPEFRTVQGRIDLLTHTFVGAARGEHIIGSLDLDGSPRSVAVRVVDRLARFGQNEPGHETLGVLINRMVGHLGAGDTSDRLRDVLIRYPFTTVPAADSVRIGRWRGIDTPTQTAEKIIGENTLRDVYLLELALDAARAVSRIKTPDAVGTGFMAAADLLVTNHHVIEDVKTAARSSFAFNFQIDRLGRELPVRIRRAKPDGIFHTVPELDVTIVELEEPIGECEPLVLRGRRMNSNERVAIIQHPGGHYKKISMQNNFVAYADEQILQYTTSTEPGSSGSPVFDDAFEVVGVHHAGGILSEPGGARHLRNEAISAIAILQHLSISAPGVAARLVR